MSAVTGPISTLAGASHEVPEGQMCDEHPDRSAVARIQGETDSFGCEMDDLCQECVDARLAYRCSEAGQAEEIEWRTGQCEWCKNLATDLRDARDYEEGMNGRVYRVCGACIKRVNDEAQAEMDAMGDYYDPRDDWDDTCGKCYGEGEVYDYEDRWRGYCTCSDGLRLKGEAEARYAAKAVKS
ncbi:hypothetical protein [Rhizobium sp. RCAM05973]|uniref:hypothetical protein n=1 Tax=Rhizobium sp. RCAM05973 TaxID=2994066 RepID=UPI0022EBAA63|nr:hypothetical protein [Rhizobium sp. RCAM05973]